MISEYVKNMDIFSQSFQFNTGKLRDRKRTFVGTFLTLSIMAATLYYFIYLFVKYMDNQIDPKFRVQNFISNDLISIPLSNELIAFQYIEPIGNLSIDQIQAKTNKTYIVTLANFMYTDNNGYFMMPLNVIPCNNTLLQGYRCIDMSKVPSNYTLMLNSKNRAQSQISIVSYRCQDTDRYKRFVPDNCANLTDINKFISKLGNTLNVKLITSQYNITAKEFQDSYKTFNLLISPTQIMYTEFKAQNQITSVKDGYIFQSEKQYFSPISYTTVTQTLDTDLVLKQAGAKYFQQFFVDVEETIYQTQIQYPTLPEILALCNTTLSLLMCLGFFGRQMAQKLIRQELFLLILQNFYQGTYEKVLRIHKFIQPNEQDHPKKINYLSESAELQENPNPITVPNIHTNSRQNQFTQQDTNLQQIQDAVLEDASVGEGQSPVIIPELSIKSSGQIINQLDLQSDTKRDCIIDQETIFSSRNNMQKLSDEENKILDQIKKEESNTNSFSMQKTQEFRLQTVNPSYDSEKQILQFNKRQSILTDLKSQKTAPNRTSITKQLFERRQMQPIVSQIAINSCDRTENNLKFDISPLRTEKSPTIQDSNKISNLIKLKPSKIPSIQQHEKININEAEKSPNSSLESKLKSINNQSIFKKVEHSLFKFSMFKKKEFLSEKGIDQETIFSIEKQVNSSLDFSQVYQEILFCKKAIMMILTKEQFAALKLVGCSERFSKQLTKSFDELKNCQMSHFEEQFAIQLLEEVQIKYINQFIEKFSKKGNISELDKKIYQSLG
ncbi:transmembrane protein, putative (macronuclear) [Tetrahymena thermophila SB210]|uniref:Transmembrane protein, putative n=1 Tax=Tetrahymena thermophila (strain SB210) TaxID=312017 RepID=Q22D59_TETTS|nr:transmembrane protein, putative [Tetrahymena thermophila SB210]EAR83194.2 transmembrane protein, putative [Tetrahymena thermophila SB210]|eukprot:XP_001030857.2 transmembrane protein, putative [Tetrahymena thermophila SB210]